MNISFLISYLIRLLPSEVLRISNAFIVKIANTVISKQCASASVLSKVSFTHNETKNGSLRNPNLTGTQSDPPQLIFKAVAYTFFWLTFKKLVRRCAKVFSEIQDDIVNLTAFIQYIFSIKKNSKNKR